MSMQLIIIMIYFAITIFIGVQAGKKATGAAAFHGSGMGVFACVAAGTGEWLGGTSTIGVSSYGYDFGLSGAWYTLANGIGVIFLALLFAKLYRSLDTVTVPGIIEKFIGVKPRVVSSVILTFVMVAVGGAQVIAAGSLGVTVMGLPYTTSIIVLGIGFIVYTLAGGMAAVANTNKMHLIAMYGGMILAIMIVKNQVGGMDALRTALPGVPYFSWFGIGMTKVSSWIVASILGACTAQAGIQPLLAAKDENTAKKAAIVTAFVVAPFGVLTAILGMYAQVAFPGLESGKLALPTLMMNINPVASGIVLASILAAILSTMAPIILASGTMMTNDIYHRIMRPNATDSEVLKMSRMTTAVAGLICIGIAMIPNLKILDLVYFAYTLRGSLFVVLLLAIYWKKVSQKGAVWAMVVTAAVGFIWVLYKGKMGHYPIHPAFSETYAAVVVAFITTLLFSSIFPKDKEEKSLNM